MLTFYARALSENGLDSDRVDNIRLSMGFSLPLGIRMSLIWGCDESTCVSSADRSENVGYLEFGTLDRCRRHRWAMAGPSR